MTRPLSLLALLLTCAACDDDKKTEEAPTRADAVFEAKTPNGGSYGDWTPLTFCPDGSYAVGFRARVEPRQGNKDDTGLNSIELRCGRPEGGELGVVHPADGPFGEWGAVQSAPDGQVLVGLRLLVEPDGADEPNLIQDDAYDDTAADSVGFYTVPLSGQTPGAAGYLEAENGIFDWARPGGPVMCPPDTALCGLALRIEGELPDGDGPRSDDTALNDVRIACCQLPSARWGCVWDQCGFDCDAAAKSPATCALIDPGDRARCGGGGANTLDVGETCRIAFAGEGGASFVVEKALGPGETARFRELDGKAWPRLTRTEGPCHFTVFGETDFAGERLTYGTGLDRTVGIGAEGMRGAATTGMARSLEIRGARIDQEAGCRLTLQDDAGGFDLLDDAEDLPELRFVGAAYGKDCRFLLYGAPGQGGATLTVYSEYRGPGGVGGGVRAVAMQAQKTAIDRAACDAQNAAAEDPERTDAQFFSCGFDEASQVEWTQIDDALCGCGCAPVRAEACPKVGQAGVTAVDTDFARCRDGGTPCAAGEERSEDPVCGCACYGG